MEDAAVPIELVEYDPSWSDAYEAERRRLAAAVGDRVDRFEHIGSTSVPGLPAKPIIDVVAADGTIEAGDDCVADLDALGYEFDPGSREVEREWRYFQRERAEEPHVNLHFLEVGSRTLADDLLFRDYLREHPGVREEYAALKRELAEEHRHDLSAYSEGKTEFVERVLDCARAED